MIRAVRNKDAKDIQDLIFDIWHNEYGFDVKLEDVPDLEKIEEYYHDAGGLFLVALPGDKIIGTIAAEKLSTNDFALKRMFVNKDFRGKGIAQALLDALLLSFHDQKLSFFLSTKENEAIAAKKFYLKNGFVVIAKSELPANFPFFYSDDLFMRRELL
ncbi:MAG: GNAT family N-acetyltransferase [Pseudomonadota bacterium]